MAVLLDGFVKSLAKSGLMTEGEVQACLDGLPPDEKPETAEDLAKLLYQQGKLTKFQTQAVYQGKTRGLVVGDYAVLDKIGQGGMGYVYKAQHRRMERVVALKVLPSALMKSDEAVQRFLREVRAAAKLNHPNVVTAFDAGEEEGIHFLVMEYVDGKDLASLVRSQGTLPLSQAMHYVTQAAKGLEYSHGQNVVHRDIKPANLLVDGDGTVKILDMGLARFTEEPADVAEAANLTHSGQVMGTIDYMSPEQAVDTHTADHRADVYSLGCTLYFLLTGRAVYGGDTLAARLLAHQRDPIPTLRALRGDVPEALDAIFRKMVAKRVDARQQSMAEVIADLEACATGQQSFAETISLVSGPTGGDDTDPKSSVAAAPLDSALEHWLNEKLPDVPTRFRPRANPLPMFSRRQLIAASVVLTVVLALLVVFGIVIAVRTPKGTILVEVDQADAEISVDDGKITLKTPGDEEPVQIEIAEGQHTLSVTKGGFHTFAKEFSITSGEKQAIRVRLAPVKTTSPTTTTDPVRPVAEWTPDAGSPPLAVAPFDATQAKKHQQAWADHLDVPVEITNSIGMTMVLIPPGEFLIGHIKLRHRVRITRPFALGRHEVTRGQFRRFVEETEYKTEAERNGKGRGFIDGKSVVDPRFVWSADPVFPQTDDHPVVNVSWNDATAFCQWLSKKQGVKYDLPTEAQWEYACRAGTTTRWYCGDRETTLEEYAWFDVNSGDKTHPVGQLKPNAWGLHDMHGNVKEWCANWIADYAQSPPNDPSGPATGSFRRHRGGDWTCPAKHCTSNSGSQGRPDWPHLVLGFRVAAVLADSTRATVEPLPEHDAAAWRAILPPDTPPAAVAPFDATQAEKHQRAWADHLGVPVESENSIGMKMVLIPPGEFMMGSTEEEQARFLAETEETPEAIEKISSEGPLHRVRITKPFVLARHEVTRGQFRQFVQETGYQTEAERDGKGRGVGDGKVLEGPQFAWSTDPGFPQTDDHPVVNVTWNDAIAFCQWLSMKQGVKYDLPTEAQWEYTCRAGTTTAWHCGNSDTTLEEYIWFETNADRMTHPAGQLKPNAWGLHDMHGNVWEWCADRLAADYYAQSPSNDPGGPTTGWTRVLRGSSWRNLARYCRSAHRFGRPPGHPNIDIGFRVASEM